LCVDIDGNMLRLGQRLEIAHDVPHEIVEPHVLLVGLVHHRVGACKRQQPLHNELHTRGGTATGVQRPLIVDGLSLSSQRPLHFGGHRGERRAELVRGVGGEPALALKRHMKAIERLVQGVCELLEFRFDAIDRNAGGEIAIHHRPRCPADSVDRRQRATDKPPATEKRQAQCRGADSGHHRGERQDLGAQAGY
jgi:hypothetical protein